MTNTNGSSCLDGSSQDHTRCHWKHASRPAEQDLAGSQTHYSREAGKPQPWWKREGSNWDRNDRTSRTEGTPKTRWNDHRAHIRKHRSWIGDGCFREGLQDDLRHARQDERGKEEHPTGIRSKGRGDSDK